jgi:Domain of unknown function (DUF4410)
LNQAYSFNSKVGSNGTRGRLLPAVAFEPESLGSFSQGRAVSVGSILTPFAEFGRLKALKLNSADSGVGIRASRDSWVITGEFVELDAGNRALQPGVGFGAGQSQLEVRAKVYAGSDMHTPFLTFDSKGASGHLPGGVAMKNPYVAAAKFVTSKREPAQEAKKVA